MSQEKMPPQNKDGQSIIEHADGRIFVRAHYRDSEGIESILKDETRYVPATEFLPNEVPVWLNYKVSRTWQIRQYEPFHIEGSFMVPVRLSEVPAAFRQLREFLQEELNEDFKEAEAHIKKLRKG
jgi:hypothetical protein